MHLSFLIGSEKGEALSNELHEISIVSRKNLDGADLVTVRLRLFALKDTPTYYAVVSDPSAAIIAARSQSKLFITTR